MYRPCPIYESSNVTLLLVNTKNDHEIDAKFLDPNEKWHFPVAVVTQAVGQTLKYVLEKYERNVEARLEISNQTHEIKHEHQQEHQQEPQGFILIIREIQVLCAFNNCSKNYLTGVMQAFTNFVSRIRPGKTVVDLVTPIESLLFPPDKEPNIASEDKELFMQVMAEFTNIEREVCHV